MSSSANSSDGDGKEKKGDVANSSNCDSDSSSSDTSTSADKDNIDGGLGCDKVDVIDLGTESIATPHELVCAMIKQGWHSHEHPSTHAVVVVSKDEFSYSFYSPQITWTAVLQCWQDYGFHIAKRYAETFGHYNTSDEDEH